MFRVIIAGSRTFRDWDLLCRKADQLLAQKEQIVIVSGGAHGADTMGEWYANQRGYAIERYPAKWAEHGKAAGMIRNRQMAQVADALICFWDGQSRGSKNMIEEMHSLNKPVRVIRF